MRQVGLTDLNPEWVFSATDQSTAWMSTKMMLPSPSPNQIIASGRSAIDGSGLNMEVSVSRRSAPTRVVIASAVASPANRSPSA
jgi:hypothetical protein